MQGHSAASPTISLCMIVRDEAEMLPHFLRAIAGAWDELCVVDTGSQDETLTLLRAAGAKIIQRPWDADFAAARNAGLDAARGTWILVLDADEIVSRDFVQAVRQVSRQLDAGAAALTMHHDLAHGHRTVSYLLRMFRSHTSLRYHGTIHEDIVRAAMARLCETGQQLVHLGGEVQHLGYTEKRARSRDKKSRDLAGLRGCVERDSGDLYSWYKMLELARFWRDTALWTDTAYEADGHISAADAHKLASAWFMGECVCLLAEGMFAGDSAQMLRYLVPWETQIAPSAAYHLRRGELYELEGEQELAEKDFRTCLRQRHRTANIQLAGVRPQLGLARLNLARGNRAAAFERIDLALRDNHRDPEALLALTTLALQVGGAASLESVVAAYVDTHGDTEELRCALGEAALRARDPMRAIVELERAQELAGCAGGARYDTLLTEARRAAAP